MTTLRLCIRRQVVADAAGTADRVEVRLPSSVDCIEEAVALLVHHCLGSGDQGSRMRFRLEVVLAEALANAIVRGNQEDPDKSVLVTVLLRATDIRIDVTDQGHGFDPSLVPEPLTPERIREAHGRGIFLIRHLADEVAFNPRGNSICVILRRR